jgi:hypothetical protein
MSLINLLKLIGVSALLLLSVPLGFMLRCFLRRRLLAALPTDLSSGLAGGLSFNSPDAVIRWSDPKSVVSEKLHLNGCKLPTGVRLFGLEVTGEMEFSRELDGAYFSDQLISTFKVWGPVSWNTQALLSEYESTAARLIELLGTPSNEVAHTQIFWGPDHKERIWNLGWLCVTHRFQLYKSEAVMCQSLLFDRRANKL